MATQIILLRGLTPTGKNSVRMEPLRAALEAAGLRKVRTWIQSGNVIASTRLGPRSVEKLVHDVIAEDFGGDVAVLARPAPYFRTAMQRNPFQDADRSKLYYTLLATPPDRDRLDAFLAPGYAPDRIEVIGDMAYILCHRSYTDLRITNNFIERKLKITATTRVHATIAKLVALTDA